VWHATSPLGPWEPHPANPVANGPREAGFRNGGRLVVHDGRLYRFGQDCGETYGHKVWRRSVGAGEGGLSATAGMAARGICLLSFVLNRPVQALLSNAPTAAAAPPHFPACRSWWRTR